MEPDEVFRRMVARISQTGRLINPTVFDQIAAGPRPTYLEAKNQGLFDGFAEIDSQRGAPPRVRTSTASGAGLVSEEELMP